jgi:uncharacterized protein YkwD
MELSRLRQQALGQDVAAAREAFAKLRALGQPAQSSVLGVAEELLRRDRAFITAGRAAVRDPSRVKALEESLASLRQAARENIKRLAKDETLEKAQENYRKLKEMTESLEVAYKVRLAVLERMARRPDLLEAWRQAAPKDSRLFGEESEKAVRAEAEQVLGLALDQALATPPFSEDRTPAAPAHFALWHYRACRRIEAHNERLRPLLGAAEFECVQGINRYREYLGILPCEVDARLIQSARRHSKEMADLNYFSHNSPTAGLQNHAQRMKAAGYDRGYSECIAYGMTSGEMAFRQWFLSPPHHQIIVEPGSVHLGVGHWSGRWTLNMGRDKRLLFLSDEERAKAAPKGDLLKPQPASATRPARGIPGRMH